MKKHILLLFISFCILYSCSSKKAEPVPDLDRCDVPVSFANDILPITTTSCQNAAANGCHEAGAAVGDYTSYPGFKAKAESGILYERVIHSRTMPPAPPYGTILSFDKIKKINCWIKQGAPDN